MSKTRIPSNGSVGETAGAAVARPRHIEHIEPLNPAWGRMGLEKRSRALNLAMLPLNTLISPLNQDQLRNEGWMLEMSRPQQASAQMTEIFRVTIIIIK